MSMNLSLSKIYSGYLVTFSFWDKKRKNIFFKNVFSWTKFSTNSLCACEWLGAPYWKTLTLKNIKKVDIFKETEFLRFSKRNCNFRNLTTDFENRTKRPAETKAYIFLDIDH